MSSFGVSALAQGDVSFAFHKDLLVAGIRGNLVGMDVASGMSEEVHSHLKAKYLQRGICEERGGM